MLRGRYAGHLIFCHCKTQGLMAGRNVSIKKTGTIKKCSLSVHTPPTGRLEGLSKEAIHPTCGAKKASWNVTYKNWGLRRVSGRVWGSWDQHKKQEEQQIERPRGWREHGESVVCATRLGGIDRWWGGIRLQWWGGTRWILGGRMWH